MKSEGKEKERLGEETWRLEIVEVKSQNLLSFKYCCKNSAKDDQWIHLFKSKNILYVHHLSFVQNNNYDDSDAYDDNHNDDIIACSMLRKTFITQGWYPLLKFKQKEPTFFNSHSGQYIYIYI